MTEKVLFQQTAKRSRLRKVRGGKSTNGHASGNGAAPFSGTARGKNPTQILVMPERVSGGTELTGVSKKVFLDRYSLKDEAGKPLEQYPEQMWRRVARAISQIEKPEVRKAWEEKFYTAMGGFKFIPGGRILSGAGTGFDVTYYNCYVLPSPKDSRYGILENLREMIEIMARGGGVGINLSSLRPKGARVKKVNGFSSGPVTWASLHSTATKDVIQQGGSRRGALMLMLWDWHPDVEEFITVKQDLARIEGANLSVCVSDRFMLAVKNNEDWPLLFPDLDDPKYDALWDGVIEHWIEKGGKVKVYKTVKASYLWDLICKAAWTSAEPGVVFMERYNKWNSNSYFNYINCVNPCGEEGLPAYGVCNLGSLNLANFVDAEGDLDYDALAQHTKIAVRFLDNVVDGDIYALPGIIETQLNGERRIGLGTMGLGDALIKMKIRYGAQESLPIVEKIYRTIRDAAFEASSDIASEKGAFPKFDREKYLQGYFIRQLPETVRVKIGKQGIRNSVLLMQAPTGTTSLLASVTSGIEPVYEFSFVRRDRIGEHRIYHPLYQAFKAAHPNEAVPAWFVSANDLTPEDHVRVQAAVQKYVDASISKTVNAPQTHTIEDVKKLYNLAYELGCKGVTYMREGSRPGVLSREEEKREKEAQEETATVTIAVAGGEPSPSRPGKVVVDELDEIKVETGKFLTERPEKLLGATYRIATPMGIAFITITNDEDGNPLEVFINIGRAGSDITAMAEALGRTMSAALRFKGGLSLKERALEMAHQLGRIGGSRSVGFGPNKVRSLPDAVSIALSKHCGFKIDNGNGNNGNGSSLEKDSGSSNNLQAEAVMAAHNPDPTPASADPEKSVLTLSKADICPKCGVAAFVHEEGCSKCYSCGHAEC